jgi:hypothetical protein
MTKLPICGPSTVPRSDSWIDDDLNLALVNADKNRSIRSYVVANVFRRSSSRRISFNDQETSEQVLANGIDERKPRVIQKNNSSPTLLTRKDASCGTVAGLKKNPIERILFLGLCSDLVRAVGEQSDSTFNRLVEKLENGVNSFGFFKHQVTSAVPETTADDDDRCPSFGNDVLKTDGFNILYS